MVARWPKRGRGLEPSNPDAVPRPPSSDVASAPGPGPDSDARKQTDGVESKGRPNGGLCKDQVTEKCPPSSGTDAESGQSAEPEATEPMNTSPKEELGVGSKHLPGRISKTGAETSLGTEAGGAYQHGEAAKDTENQAGVLRRLKREPNIADIEDGRGIAFTSGVTAADEAAKRGRAAATCRGEEGSRGPGKPPEHEDCVDWDAVLAANEAEIADVIRERGQQTRLAARIKAFLGKVRGDHGTIDLEWLRECSRERASAYITSLYGMGLKSAECILLLCLHKAAFPVDTNVGRVSVRLGWVPLEPLDEELQLHLLEQYPIQKRIQEYLWRRLSHLDVETLYEMHCQLITFGKVFCTKRAPNCLACPMQGECKHFESARAHKERQLSRPLPTLRSDQPPAPSPKVPVEPAEQDMRALREAVRDAAAEARSKGVGTIQRSARTQFWALPLLRPEKLRTVRHAVRLPDDHPALRGFLKRDPADSIPYFAVLWPTNPILYPHQGLQVFPKAAPLAFPMFLPAARKPRSRDGRQNVASNRKRPEEVLEQPNSASCRNEEGVKSKPLSEQSAIMTRSRKQKLEQEEGQSARKIGSGDFSEDLETVVLHERGPHNVNPVKIEEDGFVTDSVQISTNSSKKRRGGRGSAARAGLCSGREGCTAEVTAGRTCGTLRAPNLKPEETDGSIVISKRKKYWDDGEGPLSKLKLPKEEPGEAVQAVMSRSRTRRSEQESGTQSVESEGVPGGGFAMWEADEQDTERRMPIQIGPFVGAARVAGLNEEADGSVVKTPVLCRPRGSRGYSRGGADAALVLGVPETDERRKVSKRKEINLESAADDVFLHTRARARSVKDEAEHSALPWGASDRGAGGGSKPESRAKCGVLVNEEEEGDGLEFVWTENISLREQLEMRQDLCAHHGREVVKFKRLASLTDVPAIDRKETAGLAERKVRAKFEDMGGTIPGEKAAGMVPCGCSTCGCHVEGTVYFTVLVPCRTALSGRFPLNGTHFQANELFADDRTSSYPPAAPAADFADLPRTKVYFGTGAGSLFKGCSQNEISQAFEHGYVCVRGFDSAKGAPRLLHGRLHVGNSGKQI
ncbi:HhH-GPD base excision DNA repair family protein [Klebsormidium nitens]|uniref:HhH-GPD base excision DNA repair family protein n=1 Tax=Klebsormidium nitens TaxID=105231 RepID=A0A1Y1IJ14_KLENI|nr:HhH-GPD base excision DNA repair family protein [Klebsormidium nitens]|eukprot:GAQ90102.1 HhH-GPD base excision DNA repair family protein [Klebsormidium nitens]